jgi:hypothetical protein
MRTGDGVEILSARLAAKTNAFKGGSVLGHLGKKFVPSTDAAYPLSHGNVPCLVPRFILNARFSKKALLTPGTNLGRALGLGCRKTSDPELDAACE